MKRSVLLVLIFATMVITCVAQDKLDFNDPKVKLSYSVGYQVGSDFIRQGSTINPDILAMGVEDGRLKRQPLMTGSNMRQTLADLQQEINANQKNKMLAEAAENDKQGETFLAANKLKEGIVTLQSGLQYRIIKSGDGEKPQESDTIAVHYRGSLINGTEFDTSHNLKAPATFTIKQVIRGWAEALQIMPVGSHWQLFVPPSLAYGDKRVGSIGPNSTLIFDVELIAVVAKNK